MTAPPGAGSAGEGTVLPGFDRGAVVLKGPGGSAYRLSWDEEPASPGGPASGADRRRAVAPGTYTLAGFTLLRRDEAGTEWILRGTPACGQAREITVRAGETVTVSLQETIEVRLQSRRAGPQLRVQAALQAEPLYGLSLYRAAERIPLRCRILDAAGAQLAAGALEYG